MIELKSSEHIAQVLSARRKELSLTQEEVAILCNLSVNGLSKFENTSGEKEIKISTLFKLQQILGFKLYFEFEE